MNLQLNMPDKPGQICKITDPLDIEKSHDVYIITEDPQDFDERDTIYVVSLKELQRNISNPGSAERVPVIKSELGVVAENLQDYIKSWNET